MVHPSHPSPQHLHRPPPVTPPKVRDIPISGTKPSPSPFPCLLFRLQPGLSTACQTQRLAVSLKQLASHLASFPLHYAQASSSLPTTAPTFGVHRQLSHSHSPGPLTSPLQILAGSAFCCRRVLTQSQPPRPVHSHLVLCSTGPGLVSLPQPTPLFSPSTRIQIAPPICPRINAATATFRHRQHVTSRG